MGEVVQPAPAGRRVHYERRRPEDTVLYELVQEHLETFLAQVELETGAGLPEFVKEELDAFLECGILAHGFARARCGGCGHDFLIAYSCKGRGICPSCNTRRLAETAAHLADHVFPQVPVRQWVLSLPKRLRYLHPRRAKQGHSMALASLHHDPALIGPVLRIFLDAVEDRLKASSPGAPAPARFGAVTFVHRFGSALNANLHFHSSSLPAQAPTRELPETSRSPSTGLWAMLLARIYEVFPLLCPRCGQPMRIIAFVTDSGSITRILAYLGEPTKAPYIAPVARGPPREEDFEPRQGTDLGEPPPEFEFDQRVSW